MDHLRVLKRAWDITWRYRALWVFGAIFALGTGGGGGGGGGGSRYGIRGEDFSPERWRDLGLSWDVPPHLVSTVIGIGVGLICLGAIVFVALMVARYVAEVALIRMVDENESTGRRRTVREGFRLGWSRVAFRLFLLDLVVNVPLVAAFIVLFLLGLSPLLLWATESRAAALVGVVASVGLILLLILFAIVVGLVVSLLMRFFRRACVLEGIGVAESIRRGYAMARRQIRDVFIMALLMFGLGIAYAIVTIPLGVLVVIVAGVVGALPGALVGWLASLAVGGATPWIVGAGIGIPIFILAVAVPILFVGSLAEVYRSTAWTLTYRELRALEGSELEVTEPPQLDASRSTAE